MAALELDRTAAIGLAAYAHQCWFCFCAKRTFECVFLPIYSDGGKWIISSLANTTRHLSREVFRLHECFRGPVRGRSTPWGPSSRASPARIVPSSISSKLRH